MTLFADINNDGLQDILFADAGWMRRRFRVRGSAWRSTSAAGRIAMSRP